MHDSLATVGTLWQRLTRGVRRGCARADWEQAAGPGWQREIMEVALSDDFHAKQGRSTARWQLGRGGARLAVYLKRHYQLPRWQGWMATLWPRGDWSPGAGERRRLEWARGQGFRVPEVVACGETIGPAGKLQSFLAVEELTGMLALHQAIPQAARHLGPAEFRQWKAGLARELARVVGRLHRLAAFHKDLYLCHFFVDDADTRRLPGDWTGRIAMIDLHRLDRHPLTWPWFLVKDLAQFLYSSEMAEIDARDRLRFWRTYLAEWYGTWQAGVLQRFVLLKGWRYRDHNQKSRSARARRAA